MLEHFRQSRFLTLHFKCCHLLFKFPVISVEDQVIEICFNERKGFHFHLNNKLIKRSNRAKSLALLVHTHVGNVYRRRATYYIASRALPDKYMIEYTQRTYSV